jgi:hypothetical protein
VLPAMKKIGDSIGVNLEATLTGGTPEKSGQ